MSSFLRKLFGLGPAINFAKLCNEGAVILDVRSPQEFQSGHIRGAKNIPVQNLQQQLAKLKDKNNPIITCCASGMRSGTAKNMLRNHGYTNVYNGGSWRSLQHKISKG